MVAFEGILGDFEGFPSGERGAMKKKFICSELSLPFLPSSRSWKTRHSLESEQNQAKTFGNPTNCGRVWWFLWRFRCKSPLNMEIITTCRAVEAKRPLMIELLSQALVRSQEVPPHDAMQRAQEPPTWANMLLHMPETSTNYYTEALKGPFQMP